MQTRKRVTIEVNLEFFGDYYDLDDCENLPQNWIESALNDRSDLQSYSIETVFATEK